MDNVVSSVLDMQRRGIETGELEKRIKTLEEKRK